MRSAPPNKTNEALTSWKGFVGFSVSLPGCVQIPAWRLPVWQPVAGQAARWQSSTLDEQTWGPYPRWRPLHPRCAWRSRAHALGSAGFSSPVNPHWRASTLRTAPNQSVWCAAGIVRNRRDPVEVLQQGVESRTLNSASQGRSTLTEVRWPHTFSFEMSSSVSCCSMPNLLSISSPPSQMFFPLHNS